MVTKQWFILPQFALRAGVAEANVCKRTDSRGFLQVAEVANWQPFAQAEKVRAGCFRAMVCPKLFPPKFPHLVKNISSCVLLV